MGTTGKPRAPGRGRLAPFVSAWALTLPLTLTLAFTLTLALPAPAGAASSAALTRYDGPAGHWVTTGPVASAYSVEGTLGFLSETSIAGTTAPVYGCLDRSSDHFLSLSPGCEGQKVLRTEGWIYTSPPSGLASSAIYRCRIGTDHFAATDPGCEGQVAEGLLGYALQSPLAPRPAPNPTPSPQPPPWPAAVATTIPLPVAIHHRRVLRVRIVLIWTWHGATTRLTSARIGRLPRGATVRVSCRGPGPACRSRAMVAGVRRVRRLASSLDGRAYSAGDRLLVTVSKRGYAPERAQIRIRYGRVPAVRLR